MAEVVFDFLHVPARSDEERSAGMAEIVEPKTLRRRSAVPIGSDRTRLAAVAAGLSGEATLLGEPDHQRVARTSGNICWRGSCAAACCAPTFPDLPELERGPWS